MQSTISNASVVGRGTLRLTPIDGSTSNETYVVEVGLGHQPGVLTLGDLRVAAEDLSASGEHEKAYRLWSAVSIAAGRVGNEALSAVSGARRRAARAAAHAAVHAGVNGTKADAAFGNDPAASSVLERRVPELLEDFAPTSLQPAVTSPIGSPGPKYDYDRLVADRDDGMTRAEVAAKWGCSTSTVQRAETYVAERDDAVDLYPELLDQLMAGVDLKELSDRYSVPTKVLKWMVNTRYERRRP